MSLAKSLPRALSLAPFWCLIVAHFECPDTSHLSEEQLVDTKVARQLRVEGGHDHRALTAQHRMPLLALPAGWRGDRRAHLDPLGVEGTQALSVGGDGPLQRDDADLGHLGGPSARHAVYGWVAVVPCGMVTSSVVVVIGGNAVVVVGGRVVVGRGRVVV